MFNLDAAAALRAQEAAQQLRHNAAQLGAIGDNMGPAMLSAGLKLTPQLADQISRVSAATLRPFVDSQNQVAQSCAAIASSYRGPLTPAEVAGRVVVPTGIRFSFELGDGAIGDSIGTMTNGRSTNSFDFFNKGRGDAGKAFGFGDADLDEDHTDLIEDGDLDDGDLHENYGWEVILRPTDDGEIVEADRLKLGDFRFHWFLDSGKSGIGLGPIYRMPPEGFIEGDGQFHGRLWRTAYSSWSIRGGEKKKRFMRATHPLPDAELTKGYRLIVVSVGPVYRKPTALGIG